MIRERRRREPITLNDVKTRLLLYADSMHCCGCDSGNNSIGSSKWVGMEVVASEEEHLKRERS